MPLAFLALFWEEEFFALFFALFWDVAFFALFWDVAFFALFWDVAFLPLLWQSFMPYSFVPFVPLFCISLFLAIFISS